MMKKRKTSKTSITPTAASVERSESPTVVSKNGIFTFSNGDQYMGDYAIGDESPYLFKQGKGIYETEDFNKYECVWKADKMLDDLYIRFNNDTEYRGSVDENGNMSGQGIYYLPDRSSISAEWKKNKLSSNIRYKEPLRFIWTGEVSHDGKVVQFLPGNHFWDDMNVSKGKQSKNTN